MTQIQPGPCAIPQWSRDAVKRLFLELNPNQSAKFKINGYTVHSGTFKETFQLFWKSVRQLDRCKLHSAESLVNTPDWDGRPDGTKHAIGRSIKVMTLRGVLPLTLANPTAPYNFKYRLNDDLDQAPTIN